MSAAPIAVAVIPGRHVAMTIVAQHSEGEPMIVKSVRVRNFRSIRDATLQCDALTALVGGNGNGKSNFLRALEVFYDPAADYSAEDFYAENTDDPIRITVTFSDLIPDEHDAFSSYVGDGELAVEKVLTHPRDRVSQRYHGARLSNPDFQDIHSATAASEKRRLYGELRSTEEYSELQSCRSAAEVEAALAAWEADHPQRLERLPDNGQFFGFREVGEAHLERYTRFILVRAVRDASDEAGEARGAALGELMDLVVRSTLSQRTDVAALKTETQTRYDEIMAPGNLEELRQLESDLTGTLQRFAPDAEVRLEWQQQTLDIPLPRALPRLIEDGYLSPVNRTGHGLQRAFIVTLLQHLAAAQSSMRAGDATTEAEETTRPPLLPGLILAIEEPELYQHPTRQRLMSAVLRQLAAGVIPGVAGRTQVLYTTHSALFVGIDQFDHIRLLRKTQRDGAATRETGIACCTLQDVVERLNPARSEGQTPLTAERVGGTVRRIMNVQTNEAFFARTAALLEGPEDCATLLAYARARGVNFDAADVALVPCNGKGSMPVVIAILQGLGVPVYPVFDADSGDPSAPRINRQILRLLRQPEEDYPCQVADCLAAFETNMRESVCSETSDALTAEVTGWARENGVSDKRAWQNQVCLDECFGGLLDQGVDCPSLRLICDRLCAIGDRPAAA